MKINRTDGAQKPLIVNSVDMREPLVQDLVAAERISGRVDGVSFSVALISQISKFDGEKLPPEELGRLSSKAFLALSAELDFLGVETLLPELSTSPGKEDSENPLSLK